MTVSEADRVVGLASAPVTVIEYASFTCPHCATWWVDSFPTFKARFIDTGRARLVLRELPTQPAEVSGIAAVLARCAPPEQYFDVVSSLNAGQARLYETGDVEAWLIEAAQASGLPLDDAIACATDPDNHAALQERVAQTIGFGVRSTPTFFVDGERLADSTLEALEAAIVAQETALGLAATDRPGAP